MEFIQLRAYDNYIYAHIRMGMLQAEGINCHLQDEMTITSLVHIDFKHVDAHVDALVRSEQRVLRRIMPAGAMGDDGLSVGSALTFLHARDGAQTWLQHRHRLDTGIHHTSSPDEFIA